MPDTVRTRAALLTLLADNTSGAISPQDIRDVLVSLFGVYGSIYVTGGSATQNPGAGSETKLTLFDTVGPAQGMTASSTDDQITLDSAGGVYIVHFHGAFTHATNNTIVNFRFAVGGVSQTPKVSQKVPGSDEESAGFFGILSLAASAVCSINLECDKAGDLTMVESHFGIKKIA